MTDRIPVESLSYGVLDIKPVNTEWDSEALMDDKWSFWEAKDHTLDSGRDLTVIVRNGSSILAAYTDDGTRIDMKYGSVEVDEIECQNCDGGGRVLDEGGTNLHDDRDSDECPECNGTGNTAKLTDDEITELNDLDAYELYAEGPMMNYRYPMGDSDDSIGGIRVDVTEAAYRLRDLPLCVVEYDDAICLALTGGGMDLTWEIVDAFTTLGYMPPIHFCDLPGMSGRGKDGYNPDRDSYLIDAVERSLREQVDSIQRHLDQHRERWHTAVSLTKDV